MFQRLEGVCGKSTSSSIRKRAERRWGLSRYQVEGSCFFKSLSGMNMTVCGAKNALAVRCEFCPSEVSAEFKAPVDWDGSMPFLTSRLADLAESAIRSLVLINSSIVRSSSLIATGHFRSVHILEPFQ